MRTNNNVGSRDMPGDLWKTSKLLYRVFQSPRFLTTDYIEWLYHASPEGKSIYVEIDADDETLAHYCVIPQIYHKVGNECLMALSLNTAVLPHPKSKGKFVELAKQTYEIARNSRNIQAVLGVANANSVRGFLRRLDFALLQQLPVRVGALPPINFMQVRNIPITSDFLNSADFELIARQLDLSPTRCWGQKWTTEKLVWRLSSPIRGYVAHVHRSGMMITRKEYYRSLPLTIILKFFPAVGADRIKAVQFLSAACQFHGTPFYLYAGLNSRLLVHGIPVPRRFLPSPLNLIYRPLAVGAPSIEDFKLDVFEFLDFDAY